MPRRRLLLQVLVVVACLALPALVSRPLGLGAAAGPLSLANLGTLVICARLGWRQALASAAALALLAVAAVMSQGQAAAATAVMALTALGLGLTARWQLQPVVWLLVVSLCMLITAKPPASATPWSELISLAGVLFSSCCLSAGLQATLLGQTTTHPPEPHRVVHSWPRSLAYGLLLATTALVSTPIAMQHHWHTSGLWLILTPFLVLRPFVRNAWRVALHRALGTMAGVLLVDALALTLPRALPLQLPAVVLGAAAAMIGVKHGHPALMLVPLTASIVLFNSHGSNLMAMADNRLLANALGIAITLTLMAMAHPVEQWLAQRRSAPAGWDQGGHT